MRTTNSQLSGVKQHECRECKRNKLVVHMRDEPEREVRGLFDYEQLRQLGMVLRFEKIVVEQQKVS